ncbi:MAG: uracil-DNA glycosylase [Sulfurospirillaceae bacterium]|nr:uracil-DNA glycosylase [Sulfurospirillaceae bacterium]
MINLEKAKLLKQLYQYKSFGFEYFKDYKPLVMPQNKPFAQSLHELEDKVMQCHLCQLAKGRKNIVFGEGNQRAKLMFIGEGPGANEDETGKPFVGRAGMLLTKIIENVLELKREDVYITNIVKCRPPNNRVPSIEESESCKPYLLEQIAIIKPEIIVALGSTSYHYLSEDYDMPISKIRGEILEYGNAKLIPTYHPSFLLRNPSAKKEVYADMLKVKRLL